MTGPTGSSRQKLQELQEQAAQRARDRRRLVVVALLLVVLVVGGGLGLQAWRTSRSPVAAPAATGTFAPLIVAAGKPIVLGQAGAPVRVQLYEDFHCPHCADFEAEFGPTITAEQQSGRVAVELYPMSFIDVGSAAAANAMACAAEAGFGQAYYLGLFANHNLQWSDRQLTQLATQVSTSVPPAFDTCVTERSHGAYVDSVNAVAAKNGVSSTPTLLVDGSLVDISSLTPAKLTALLDQAAHKKASS